MTDAQNLPQLLVFMGNFRRSKNWTAEQFGDWLGWSKGMVYAVEDGRTLLGARSLGRFLRRVQENPALPKLERMALDYLLWAGDQPSPTSGPRPHVDRSGARQAATRKRRSAKASKRSASSEN